MSNREIEAILKISSRLGSMQALKTLQRELKAVDNQAKAYNRTQAVLNRGINASGMLIGRYLTGAALGYAALDMTRTVARIEDAMFGIQKKSGASAEQIAKLKGEILSLGQEVPVSIEEIASAFERGAAAGIPLEDLREFAKLTAQVSDSWDMTAEDTANAFAGFSAGIGIKREDLEQFADLINFLADSGIADESGIVDFLDRAGASLKNFGMSPDESAAFGAALLNLKMAPEIAARAMDTLAGKLIAPENLSKSSFGALKEIVGDVEKFQALVANDGAKGMIEFFDRLDKMSGQKRTSLLGALMGEGFDDEVARMVDGIGEIKKNLELAQQENLYKGSIAGLSEKKLDLFSSKLKLLQNDLTNLKDNLFEASAKDGSFLDVASGAIRSINDATDKNDAIKTALDKKGIKGFWAQEKWRLQNGSASALDSLAVDGGYNMDKQVLPELKMPGAAPAFPEDVPLPMPRPGRPQADRPRRGFDLPPISYPDQEPYFPLQGDDMRRADAGGDASRMEFLTAAAGAKLEEGGDRAGKAVADGGEEAGKALIDGAAALRAVAETLRGAAASIGGAMRALNTGAVRGDTGRSGVETEARNFVP
jgi:TP901 family phage tail tape measure protein